MSKHKYSSILLIIIGTIVAIVFLASAIEIGEKSVCENELGIITSDGKWECMDFESATMNLSLSLQSLEVEENITAKKYCFSDGTCMIHETGTLYADLRGINNSMPENGSYYEVMFK